MRTPGHAADPRADKSRVTDNPTFWNALAKVHVLPVDRNPENIAELGAAVTAGRVVDDWQMPMGARPGGLVIWYAAGRQEYIALGWVDDIPSRITGGR